MTRVLGVLLFVFAGLTLSSCQKENKGLPTSNVTWNLTLPESASDAGVHRCEDAHPRFLRD